LRQPHDAYRGGWSNLNSPISGIPA
jgi:hypothetical protein